jgi:hypothetical protein
VSVSTGDGVEGLFNASRNSLYSEVAMASCPSRRGMFQVVDMSSNYFSQVVGTGLGNGSDGTACAEMNCLTGILSQCSHGDCENFY